MRKEKFAVVKVGNRYFGTLPENDGASFNLDANGPVFLLAITSLSTADVVQFLHGHAEFGLIDEGSIGLWLYRFYFMSGDAPFNVSLYPPGEGFDWSKLDSEGQPLLVQCILVERSNKKVRAMRMISISAKFSRLLRGLCSRQEQKPIDRGHYDAAVSAAFVKYFEFDKEIQAADIWEKAGRL